MIGSWRWNVIAAAACAAAVFLLAWRNNPLDTAAVRTAIAFAVTFAVAYAVRWMLGEALKESQPEAEEASRKEESKETRQETQTSQNAGEDDAHKGKVIDLTTPEDSAEDHAEEEFAPLQPPKLARTMPNMEPERLAQALRKMSDQ